MAAKTLSEGAISDVFKNYEQTQRALPDLLRTVLYSPDKSLQWGAVGAVRAIGIDNAYDPDLVNQILREAMEKGSEATKAAAILLAGDSARNASPLIPAMIRLSRYEDALRPLIVESLGRIGVREGVVPELVEAYCAGRHNPLLRAQAGLALVRLGVRSIAPELIGDAKSDTRDLRLSAIRSLGNYRPVPSEALSLLKVAVTDEDPRVRAAAILGLSGVIGMDADVNEAICKGLLDSDVRVESAAIHATLSRDALSRDVIVLLVADAAGKKGDPVRVKQAAQKALIGAGSFNLGTLVGMLKGKDVSFDHKVAVANAIAGVSAAGVKELVCVASSGPDTPLRWVATLGLGKSDGYEDISLPGLVGLLKDPQMSFHALLAIKDLKVDPDALRTPLASILEAGDRYDEPTQSTALRIIKERGVCGPGIRRALTKASKSRISVVASEAEAALQAIDKGK